MKNTRIVTALLILVSLAALLLLPAQVFAGNPPDTASSVQNPIFPRPLDDPSKAVPDSTAYLNKADPTSPIYDPKIQLEKREPTMPLGSMRSNDHYYWGSLIYSHGVSGGGNLTGVYARQSARLNLDLPSVPDGAYSTTLYAPTLILSNNCPVESVTMYWRGAGQNSTTREWGVWNHAIGNFVVLKEMNSDFVSDYVRYYQDYSGSEQDYITTILKSSGTYYVYLYNFNTNSWETQYSCSSGSSYYGYGWDMWEIYKDTEVDWPTLPDIQANDIEVTVNGSDWYVLNSNFGTQIGPVGDIPYTKTWIS